MKRDILINATDNESRIAITEDGKLAELYVDSLKKNELLEIFISAKSKSYAGN